MDRDSDRQLNTRLRQAAHFFYALRDPLRLRLLIGLAQAGEMTVTELVRAVRVSQPLVSWHLGRLRAAGLVRVERAGRIARYSANLKELERRWADFRALLTDVSSDWEQDSERKEP